MKASIFLLTILGMIAINIVTGSPIKDPQQEGPISAVISEVNIISRQKRSGTITVCPEILWNIDIHGSMYEYLKFLF